MVLRNTLHASLQYSEVKRESEARVRTRENTKTRREGSSNEGSGSGSDISRGAGFERAKNSGGALAAVFVCLCLFT